MLPPHPHSTAKLSPLSWTAADLWVSGRLQSVSGNKPRANYIAQAGLKFEQSSCLSLLSAKIDLLLFNSRAAKKLPQEPRSRARKQGGKILYPTWLLASLDPEVTPPLS